MKTQYFTQWFCLFALLLFSASLGAKPLKIYIMAGQSNMQGYAHVKTFPHMKMDAKTAPILKKMVNADGTPRVFDDIWISTAGTDHDGKTSGKLTAGFGGGRKGPRFGPELTFGIYMQEHLGEPILIIKTSWGGKSLAVDFRPPSAGVHPAHAAEITKLKQEKKDVTQAQADYAKQTGHYYRLMTKHVKSVLGNIKKVYPDYDASMGCEIAGFVWFQGANDFGHQSTYPDPGSPGGYDEYSRLLACLIRDLRKEVNLPNLPTVIGVLGFNGELETKRIRQIEPKHVQWLQEFRKAMAAPAKMPEFKGAVTAVHTEKFWDAQLEELQSRWPKIKAKSNELKKQNLTREQRDAAIQKHLLTVYTPEEWNLMEIGVSHAAYHYMGSAKIMAQIGKGFAEAMIGLSESKTNTAKAQLFPGKESVFQGKFKMFKNGGNIVVVPNKIADGKPWVWRARFWRHEPQFDVAMLEKGYHVVYCNVGGFYGNPTAVDRWDKYYKWLVEEHGFAKKAVLEGMSRGGLIIYNWAIANPDKVAAIYGDAPVMDMRSWPGAGNKATLRAYNFKDATEAEAYKGYPIDNLKPLAQAGIPIIHVVGDKDKVVPVSENTAIAAERYKALGGTFEVIHKKDVGHHPHSLKDPTPIVEFIEKHIGKKKSAISVEHLSADKKVVVKISGKLFTEYRYGNASKPILYPIIGPHGIAMTRHYPMKKSVAGEAEDHPHHQSLYYAHIINGVDFWHARKDVRIQTTKILKAETDGGDALIVAKNAWMKGKKIICTDTTTIRCGLTKGGRFVDYEITIHASETDTIFEETKEGTMAIRTHPALRLKGKVAKGSAINSEGVTGKAVWGKTAKWLNYWGDVEGKTVGIAIFDHPKNPRHPTTWHARDYGLITANPFGKKYFKAGQGALKLKKGESVTFAYRFLFHEGDHKQAKISDSYDAWVK
ncbi:MAG: DUF6807 family protein [Akkermansiaceae bacterium]